MSFTDDWVNIHTSTPTPVNWKTFSHKDNVLIHFINSQGESEIALAYYLQNSDMDTPVWKLSYRYGTVNPTHWRPQPNIPKYYSINNVNQLNNN